MAVPTLCNVAVIGGDRRRAGVLFAGGRTPSGTFLTRLTPVGTVSFSSYLDLDASNRSALAVDVNGTAYAAGSILCLDRDNVTAKDSIEKIVPLPVLTSAEPPPFAMRSCGNIR
jgi:hypothetical protein